MRGFAAFENPVVLIGRLLLSLIFVVESWLKISDYADTVAYMQAHGVSGLLLPLVIMTELGGGLLVALGLFTRLAAVGLGGFCLLTALFFHMAPDQAVDFYKNLAMAGGFLILAAHGAGTWSIDAWKAGASRPVG